MLDAQHVAGLFDRAVEAFHRELAVIRTTLVTEVEQLSSTISTARHEVARIRTGDAETAPNPIPDAADELDAIVEHTAHATETILEASEAVDAMADSLSPEVADAIRIQTMRIFEACSFQDITGQRISRVVTALKLVEDQLAMLAGSWGAAARRPTPPRDPLLNGPQAKGVAIDQQEIDNILNF